MSGQHRTVFYLRGPLADHDHVRVLASILHLALGAAGRAPRAQAADELAAELTSALDKEGLVDRLVAHLHHQIAWELEAQAHRYLLGRPQLLQPGAPLADWTAIGSVKTVVCPGFGGVEILAAAQAGPGEVQFGFGHRSLQANNSRSLKSEGL